MDEANPYYSSSRTVSTDLVPYRPSNGSSTVPCNSGSWWGNLAKFTFNKLKEIGSTVVENVTGALREPMDEQPRAPHKFDYNQRMRTILEESAMNSMLPTRNPTDLLQEIDRTIDALQSRKRKLESSISADTVAKRPSLPSTSIRNFSTIQSLCQPSSNAFPAFSSFSSSSSILSRTAHSPLKTNMFQYPWREPTQRAAISAAKESIAQKARFMPYGNSPRTRKAANAPIPKKLTPLPPLTPFFVGKKEETVDVQKEAVDNVEFDFSTHCVNNFDDHEQVDPFGSSESELKMDFPMTDNSPKSVAQIENNGVPKNATPALVSKEPSFQKVENFPRSEEKRPIPVEKPEKPDTVNKKRDVFTKEPSPALSIRSAEEIEIPVEMTKPTEIPMENTKPKEIPVETPKKSVEKSIPETTQPNDNPTRNNSRIKLLNTASVPSTRDDSIIIDDEDDMSYSLGNPFPPTQTCGNRLPSVTNLSPSVSAPLVTSSTHSFAPGFRSAYEVLNHPEMETIPVEALEKVEEGEEMDGDEWVDEGDVFAVEEDGGGEEEDEEIICDGYVLKESVDAPGLARGHFELEVEEGGESGSEEDGEEEEEELDDEGDEEDDDEEEDVDEEEEDEEADSAVEVSADDGDSQFSSGGEDNG